MSTGINIKKRLAILDESSSLTTDASSINFVGAGVTATTVGNNVTVTVSGGASSSPFNAFQYNVTNLSAAPTSGQANFSTSEGDVIGIRINYTTFNSLGINGYLTNRLNNTALLINIPTNANPNSIMIVSNFVDNGTYCSFDGTIVVGNAFPNAGAGTLTFIP